ncbi:MAG: ribosome silencing factor [Bacteroidia bacterium]
MAKLPAKKTATKKASSKKASPLSADKAGKKAAAKKTVKRPLTEKEELQKEANRIANTEKKRKVTSSAKRPKKNATKAQTTGLLDAIVEGMQEKKAKNITIINLIGLENRVADYFVICDADSTTHVNAIADTLEESVMKKTGEKPYHSEGHQNAEWILIDYVNIVAHVFMRETREFYNIEGLWADGEVTRIED